MSTRAIGVIRSILAAWLMLLLSSDPTTGFAFSPTYFTTRRSSSSSSIRSLQAVLREPPSSPSSSSSSSSTDDMKRDIEAMRQEAMARLEALNVEIMQEVKQEKADAHASSSKKKKASASTTTTTTKTTTSKTSSSSLGDSLDSMEGDLTKIPLTETSTKPYKSTTATDKKDKDADDAMTKAAMDQDDALQQQQQQQDDILDLSKPLARPKANLNLLDDTRWKIMFNIGREPGTWMPPAWGKSGDRLRFYAIVDFSSQTVQSSSSQLRDDFFEDATATQVAAAAAAIGGENFDEFNGSATKELRVIEAWLGPTYTADYHGREELKVSPIGAYKVLRGAGPLETDVLRFYIEAQDSIMGSNRDNSGVSDVSCPKGRIYGNCGYFPVHAANEVDPGQLKRNQFKDMLKKEHITTANRLEALQREGELDSRGMFSWDAMKRMKESMVLKRKLENLDARIQEARQRDPDRSTLRLSSKGNVGVTREGGVCCKVQKGITVEYHILGRMELGPVEIHKPEEHEDYADLVRKQQEQQHVHP